MNHAELERLARAVVKAHTDGDWALGKRIEELGALLGRVDSDTTCEACGADTLAHSEHCSRHGRAEVHRGNAWQINGQPALCCACYWHKRPSEIRDMIRGRKVAAVLPDTRSEKA